MSHVIEMAARVTGLPAVDWAANANYPLYAIHRSGLIFSTAKGGVLSPGRTGNYTSIRARHVSGIVTRYVHRLVLEFWTGTAPEGMDGCHNNGIGTDNRIENLRWDTRSNNHADKTLHNTATQGERHPQAKLSESDVLEIRRLVAGGCVQRSLCAKYGVSPMSISRAVNGQSWSHI